MRPSFSIADKKPREKRNEETDLSKTSQKSDSIPEATPVSHEKALTKRKLVKDFKRKIKNHQNTLQTTSNSTMCTVSIMNGLLSYLYMASFKVQNV